MQLTNENLPPCAKCEGKLSGGSTYIMDMWLCGPCLVKHINKLKEQGRKAILEE